MAGKLDDPATTKRKRNPSPLHAGLALALTGGPSEQPQSVCMMIRICMTKKKGEAGASPVKECQRG